MKFTLTFTLLLFLSSLSQAQYSYSPVFPNDSGAVLLPKLVQDYRPSFLTTYNIAKDYMFSNIYEENDTVECVYTGMKRYLNPALDPSVAMYDNANTSTSFDTEHTFPQSKGASGQGRADLHHMFPSKATVNNARGSVRMGITNDNSVDKWYVGSQTLTNLPPLAERYLYSELINNTLFEPRDEHKGNVARAMFYFYTMYKTDADAADPSFFNAQRSTLCQWHIEDPVDSMEWVRTYRIAQYQQNKVNPFVLDCSLAQRAYCSGIISCSTPPTSIQKVEKSALISLENYPNPFSQNTTIAYQLEQPQDVLLEVFDNLGRKIKTLTNSHQAAGYHQVGFDAQNLPSSIYFYKITLYHQGKSSTLSKSMILNK